MNFVALKMLFGERAKSAMLISGICFATILMVQGLALGLGLLATSYATATNRQGSFVVMLISGSFRAALGIFRRPLKGGD